MQKIFYECENCKSKAYEQFPKNWIHLRRISMILGQYPKSNDRDRDNENSKIDGGQDLTFCCKECVLQFIGNLIPPKYSKEGKIREKDLERLEINGDNLKGSKE